MLSSVCSEAQKEANYWYFGFNAGLDFSNGTPIPIKNGNLHTLEGCATISDKDGNLLFYTDGLDVYSRNHSIMKNGSGLAGNESSTQSSIIVPHPDNKYLYYIFTTDAIQEFLAKGLRYSVVDLSLNDSLGEVIEKNILLNNLATEKITAIKHINGKDFWIVSHKYGSNEFLVYALTANGINLTPVSSKVGEVHGKKSVFDPSTRDISDAQGYLRASPKGDKVAIALPYSGVFEVFDFDNRTGKLTNPRKCPYEIKFAYGIEFSPNGKLIYLGSWEGKVYQFNLEALDIFSSRIELYNSAWVGAIQSGPDGRLYITKLNKDNYIDVIKNPNQIGLGCNYTIDAINLGKEPGLGLPNFVVSYFEDDGKKEEPLDSSKNCKVYIPNSFTPNRDLQNDTFSVFLDNFSPKKYNLSIYNRWGGEVFNSNNYLQSWDGKFKDKDCPNGVYMYVLNLLHCNKIRNYKGNITLLR